ncbi:PH domain protein [Dictyocaulus viviparus]|uniref:PH domain protein n=1 Tax=Dictyocaulus viviparus TaxID=29172 RepID=A0A0D8XP76_DICVI|nr:PH domain protein [Dictyocaulus viviparus]
MADSIYMEGWLIRSRERSMHFPPFKSKWVRRYFVLRVCDKKLGTYVLDEFRKEDKRRLRKSLDLVRCVQIDSHLQLADSSCSTTTRFGGFQWIFSLYFTKEVSSQKKTPLYFVSESEEKMKDWVYSLCLACHLEKENDDENNSYFLQQPLSYGEVPSHRSTIPSSLGGFSVYSDRSSESMLDTPRSEVSREFEKSNRQHTRWRNFRRDITAQRNCSPSIVRNKNDHQGRCRIESLGRRHSSSPSVCSSVTSNRRSEEGEDDSTSCISQLSNLSCGPPIPPRSRLGQQHSSASSSTGVPVKRIAMDYLPPITFHPSHSNINEVKENDSSGETIKMYTITPCASSQCSSDDRIRFPAVFQPPAVDRSNKPAKLRLYDYEENKLDNVVRGYNKSSSIPNRAAMTLQARTGAKYTFMREPPKSAGHVGRSRELDYFNPLVLDRAHSIRNPVSSDIEYIKIDAENTQARLLASAGHVGRSRELDYFNPLVLDRAHSIRSPVSSDIEYIKIDAEKTQAVKQSIAQRTTVE